MDAVPDEHRVGQSREWLEDWTDVSGVEGLVVNKMDQRY